ncbi:MAG TPA: DUF6516 family protein [Candidatus Methanoperedens sp.]
MIDSLLARLAEIAETEFADVVITSEINMGKLRLYINDESFLEVWFSKRLEGRYAYHWERRHVDDTIYRWDNAKHEVWKNVKTFPYHFHDGKDEKVSESSLPEAPDDALRYTLIFVRKFLYKNEIDRSMRDNKSAL